VLIGLGETGNKKDYDIVYSFFDHEDPKIKLAAMIAMWYLSKDDAVGHVIGSIESGIQKSGRSPKSF